MANRRNCLLYANQWSVRTWEKRNCAKRAAAATAGEKSTKWKILCAISFDNFYPAERQFIWLEISLLLFFCVRCECKKIRTELICAYVRAPQTNLVRIWKFSARITFRCFLRPRRPLPLAICTIYYCVRLQLTLLYAHRTQTSSSRRICDL